MGVTPAGGTQGTVRSILGTDAGRGRESAAADRHRGSACLRGGRLARALRYLLAPDRDLRCHLQRGNARVGTPHRPRRHGLALSDRPARRRRVGGAPARLCDVAPLPDPAPDRGSGHGDPRRARRASRAPTERPLPRLDHPDGGGGDHDPPEGRAVPERRRRLLRELLVRWSNVASASTWDCEW